MSSGYDAPHILEKVRRATKAVLAGEAVAERDSVALSAAEYSLPLLVGLLYVASRSNGSLSVLDFGGSLGSGYWQTRKFLQHLRVQWSIVEQPHFVRVGQAEIANDVLRFYFSIDDSLAAGRPDVILLSGVLQYIELPFSLLDDVFGTATPHIIIERTQFFVEDLPDRLTVENVHPSIYEASYPSWFFNLSNFRKFIAASKYRCVEEFDSWERWDVDGAAAQNKCLLLEYRRS